MAILVDTGPLYSLADADDQYHEAVVSYVSATSEALIVPSPVVPEVCYLLLEYLGVEAETQFLRSLSGQELLLEHFTTADLGRAISLRKGTACFSWQGNFASCAARSPLEIPRG